MRGWGYSLVWVGIIATTLQIMIVGPHLPERVASHFGANGQPNGFMGRTNFLVFSGMLQILLPAFLLGMGKLTYVMPAELINLPHKDYWLDEDRRATTLRHLETSLIWITGLTSVFLTSINALIFFANRHERPINQILFWVVLGLYLLLIGWCVVAMMRRYTQVPEY